MAKLNFGDIALLKFPSVIRVHKIATLEKDMVELIMGQLDTLTKNKVKKIISKLTD
jgi:mRNA interferase MazF